MKRLIKKILLTMLLCCGAMYMINAQTLGDVNQDAAINIIDALMIAQYYVGLNPSNFRAASADVDANGTINIIDALLVAQYYVGIITQFPAPTPTSGKDVFGITMIYPSKAGEPTWDSRHWNNGTQRTLSYDYLQGRDPYDTTTWSEYRGDGTLRIDGNGVLFMGGGEPRIYINPYDGESTVNPEMFYKNVEITVYNMRIGSDGANWGGCVIGARSGPQGHSGENNCTATTYYARLRHDGSIDFEKELMHTPSAVGISKVYFGGSPLPSNKWFGVKFCCYNIDNNQHVKLEMYLETSGNGTGSGTWQKVLEFTDSGSWSTNADGCSFPANYIVTEGGGVPFIRDTNAAEARYKMFSVREINAQ